MPSAGVPEDARLLAMRVLQFALVSGIGLALDFGLFLLLVEGGVRTGWANLISAGAAVAFVYLVSVRRIFAYEGQFLLSLFALYVIYQVAAVSSASWLIDFISYRFGLAPIWAKSIILPLTFAANFLFMTWLTRTKQT